MLHCENLMYQCWVNRWNRKSAREFTDLIYKAAQALGRGAKKITCMVPKELNIQTTRARSWRKEVAAEGAFDYFILAQCNNIHRSARARVLGVLYIESLRFYSLTHTFQFQVFIFLVILTSWLYRLYQVETSTIMTSSCNIRVFV